MRVRRRAPNTNSIGECVLCGNESAEEQYRLLTSGDPASPVLMIRTVVSPKEAAEGKLWVDEAGYNFRRMMSDYFVPLSSICTTVLLRCPREKILVRHVKHCKQYVQRVVVKPQWKVIICLGRESMKHVFLRGGTPPSMDVLLGRFVDVPEITEAKVTILPEPSALILIDETDTVDAFRARAYLMRHALEKLRKEYTKYVR